MEIMIYMAFLVDSWDGGREGGGITILVIVNVVSQKVVQRAL